MRGLFYYAYPIIDLYDRSVVGWAIEETESDEHSARLFARVVRQKKVLPQIVHADNGHPMKGVTPSVFLDGLKISRSSSRPRCSNDNAFIDGARSWYADFVHWYNTEHLHSGLGYMTPHQQRFGKAASIHAVRNHTIANARNKNPLRWRGNRIFTYHSKPVSVVYRPVIQVA